MPIHPVSSSSCSTSSSCPDPPDNHVDSEQDSLANDLGTSNLPEALKDLKEELRQAILKCLYYRNKYLKRLRAIALESRNRLAATPDRPAPPGGRPSPTPVHDPEVESGPSRPSRSLERRVAEWESSAAIVLRLTLYGVCSLGNE
jgi:hypothetical protein